MTEVAFKVKLLVDGKEKIVDVKTDVSKLAEEFDKVRSASVRLRDKLLEVNQSVQAFQNVAHAVGQLQGVFREFTQAYAAQEAAESRLANNMRNTMAAREEDIQSIKDLCAAQQQLGVIGDEVQLAGAQELATYLTKKESLEKLIPVMNDMLAQQYGLNATQEQGQVIAMMLGKVMDGQVGALSRYGYKFNEAQEQILRFGTEQQRVAVLAEVVTSAVGGSNEALRQTPSGQIKAAADRFADLKEAVGQMVAPLAGVLQQIGQVAYSVNAIAQLTTTVQAAAVAVGRWSLAVKLSTAAMGLWRAASVSMTATSRTLSAAMRGAAAGATTLKVAIRGLMVATGVGAAITVLSLAVEKLFFSEKNAAEGADELSEASQRLKRMEEETSRVFTEASSTLEIHKSKLESLIKAKESGQDVSKEEKKIVDELNGAYGTTMGYFTDISSWYKALVANSEDYCRQMVIEAKTRIYANQIAELQEKRDKQEGINDAIQKGLIDHQKNTIIDAPGAMQDMWKWQENAARESLSVIDGEIEAVQKKIQAAIEEGASISFKVKGSTTPPKKDDSPTKTDKKDEQAERERRKQAQEKLGQELADLQRKNDAAEIAAMKEGAAKKLREIDNEHQARQNAIDKQEADWKRENKKAGVETGDNGLTADQTAALKKARELNDQAAAAGRQSELDAARRAWEEYLAEYGSFEEKRQALQSLYAAKMEEAGYAGEKAALQKELDGKLKELNFDEFKAGIDFAEVFGNIDTQSSAALATLRDKLKEYISKAAKDLKPDDLKALREALTKIDLKITERNPFEGFKNDLGELKAAYEKVRQAQEDLNAVTDGAKVYVEEYDKETGKVVKKLLTQEQAERRLAQAQSERFTKMAEATQSLHAGVEKAREYGEAAEAVMDMLGELGVQLPEEIGGIVGGYGQALDGLASIDLTKPASILTGGVKALTGLVKAQANILTLGGIDFGGKKSIRRYEEAKAEYEKYMAVLDRVIAKQKELVASMDASDYLNADNSYNKAKEAIAKSEQAARNLGRQYLDSGASKGFLGIGSSASRGVSQRKDMSNAAWAEFNALKRQTDEMQKLGLSMQTMNDASTGRMKGLFDMNAKQLEWLQANAPTFWAQLHDDTRKYLEQIIACGDEWEEIEAARRESLTKMTFDEFYSSWLEKIKDMKSDVKDVADAMEEQFQNAILTSLMEKKYRQQLQDLYKQWAEMTESGGKLDDAEIEALRKERDRIAAEAIRDRNELAETFGWKDETATAQSGKAGGFNAMSQDQGTKLEGLFVSGQIHWASIDDKLTDVATQMSIAGGTLLKIEENTGANARSAAAILDEMKKMIRDGIKVK